jgi:hypothetical protein
VLARELSTLTDGVRHFAGFTQADTDPAALVANDNERAEIETTPALDDFGGTVDEHDLLDQFLRRAVAGLRLR